MQVMVRREEAEPVKRAASCCTSPTGASPVPVGAGAPGSRPPSSGRDPDDEAGRRKPLRREQARGPQHQVKPAASTDKQWGSRAAHVTAKATAATRESGCVDDSSGVWGAARVQGAVWNTRDPSASPQSRQGGSYKSKTKSSAAQRESEGVAVPMIAATNNAAGGKGLCFGRVHDEGKREGMADEIGPNDPGERRLDEEVRQPQAGLWTGAKCSTFLMLRADVSRRGDARRVARTIGALVTQASSRRPSVSRMPEIGTYGLKGGSALLPMTNVNV